MSFLEHEASHTTLPGSGHKVAASHSHCNGKLEGVFQQSSPTENAAEALGSQRVWVSTAPMFLTCCLGTEPRAGPISNTYKWEIIQGDHRELQ